MAAVLNRAVLDQLGRAQEDNVVSVGSNEGKVATQNLGWMRPTDKDTPLEEMRRRLRGDGYLFLKRLILVKMS
jgi:phytanoyl-CoA hydroxylase